MITGKVGAKKLIFKTNPQGKSGEAEVMIGDIAQSVKWIRDEQGIWIETPAGFFGYDVRKTTNDEGQAQYSLLQRKQAGWIAGPAFLKAGEEVDPNAAGKVKKSIKIKSQMPGKIVRILIRAGDEVKKGQALLVMEAMKMENEIKAIQDGVVKEIKVTEGQAVETGAELILFG
jgi:biotin carboxyl carrier protein